MSASPGSTKQNHFPGNKKITIAVHDYKNTEGPYAPQRTRVPHHQTKPSPLTKLSRSKNLARMATTPTCLLYRPTKE